MFQGSKAPKFQEPTLQRTLYADSTAPKAEIERTLTLLIILLSSMRGMVVDDVQCSCYYLKVPRVRSGLPVFGSLVKGATRAGNGLR